MTRRAVHGWCVVLLIAFFALDAATPQLFVVSILLNAPIALSGLLGDARGTYRIVVAALVLDAAAGYINGLHDHSHWDAIGIGNRLLAALSFLLVGLLTSAAASNARKFGELAARRARLEAERPIREAITSIRGLLNAELVYRTAAAAAARSFGGDFAIVYALDYVSAAPQIYRAERRGDVEFGTERQPPEILSLVQRVLETRELAVFERTDPVGRLVLDTIGANAALAAPIVDRDQPYGVLLIARRALPDAFATSWHDLLGSFADQIAQALAQSRLFVRLAEKNEELAAANRALAERGDVIRDIVYATSHDLRAPLAAAELTQRQALAGAYGELPDALRDILLRSVESTSELQRLAETLLLVARYEAGEQSRARERVDLVRLVDLVIGELAPLAGSRGVALARDGGGPIEAIGEPGDLRRAVTNLVANAVAYTPRGGHVRVRIGRDDTHVSVAIEDDGYGVPLSERGRLFDRFAGEVPRGGAGLGLGLYLVRRVAQAHGGGIDYAPGTPSGSVFTLTLPVASPAAVREQAV